MKIEFFSLSEQHFPLLLKWLKTPHVRKWWDSDIAWNLDKIKEKYSSYTKGYKIENAKEKTIKANIIMVDDKEIGYIQHYNFYDFSRDFDINSIELPQSLSALDFFIGENNFIGKGIGTLILKNYLATYIDPKYKACFVDLDISNKQAIRSYEKAGFKKIKSLSNKSIICMIRKNPHF